MLKFFLIRFIFISFWSNNLIETFDSLSKTSQIYNIFANFSRLFALKVLEVHDVSEGLDVDPLEGPAGTVGNKRSSGLYVKLRFYYEIHWKTNKNTKKRKRMQEYFYSSHSSNLSSLKQKLIGCHTHD